MPRKQSELSVEKIDELRAILANLPPKDKKKGPSEVASMIMKDVEKAVEKGYTIKELTKILNEQGKLETSFQTYYRYFPKRKKKTKQGEKQKTPQKANGTPDALTDANKQGFVSADLPDNEL